MQVQVYGTPSNERVDTCPSTEGRVRTDELIYGDVLPDKLYDDAGIGKWQVDAIWNARRWGIIDRRSVIGVKRAGKRCKLACTA